MFIVEMCGGRPFTPEHRHFRCHGKVWEQILQLASEWGWKPLGTMPDGAWGRDYWGDAFIGDYRPGDAGKIVSAQDGKSLAEALVRAIANPLQLRDSVGPVIIVENMTAQQFQTGNAPLSVAVLKAFVRFVEKGAFSIFWDD